MIKEEQVRAPEVETAAPNAVAATQAVVAPQAVAATQAVVAPQAVAATQAVAAPAVATPAVAVAPATIQNQPPVTLSVRTPNVTAQACEKCEAEAGSAAPPTPIYALGSIRAGFPNMSLEKEFQATAAAIGAAGPTNSLLYQVLSQGENLYLARDICFIFQVDGVDAYIIKPRTYVEVAQFVTALDPSLEKPLDGIIGVKGPLAPPEMCNGLQLPLVAVNQSFISNLRAFVEAIAQQAGVSAELAQSVLEAILGLTDNTGATDEYRAINYLAVKYPQIYVTTSQMLDPGQAPGGYQGAYYLVGVSAQLANVQGTRRIVNVIFKYIQQQTSEVAYWFSTVDVSGLYPFLVSKFAPYYPGP